MSNTNTNTIEAKPGKFELIKNFEEGFWELHTPTPSVKYILSPPTEDWLDVVYKLGQAMENYRGKGDVLPDSIREVSGIKQLIGGW